MEGEGLTFTEAAEASPQSRIIGKEEIERIHAPDLASLLEEALDTPVSRYGPYGNATGIHLRGLGSGRVAILIDGTPVNSPQSGEFDLSMIDVNSIESIEVVYGGSDARYNVSGAVGGLINIVTQKGQEPGFRFGGSLSNTSTLPGAYVSREGGQEAPRAEELIDTQKVSMFARFGAEKFSWSAGVFANRAQNHFIFEDPYGVNRRRENNEVLDAGASASFIRDFDLTRLRLSGDFYRGDKNIPGKMFSAAPGKQKDFSTRQNLLLDMPRVFRDELSAELSLSHHWQDLDYGEPGGHSLHRVQTLQGINRWGWYPKPELSLFAGADYRFTRLDSTNTGQRTGHDGGFSLTAEYRPFAKLLVVPSVKMVFKGADLTPVPKLGLLWAATEFLTLKNNYFRTFKFPNFNDLYWSGDATAQGNPDLKPEDGFGTDLSADFLLKGGFSLETALFASLVRDTIHWRPVNGITRPVNIGEAALFGLDARLRGNIPLPFKGIPKLEASLSFQYLLSYILSGDISFASRIRMPYMPLYTAGVSLLLPWKTGSLRVSGHYEGLRYAAYTVSANVGRLEPHVMLNLVLNQRISKNCSAFLTLNNLLNRPWFSIQDYPLPGLSITLGLEAAFERPQVIR
jgi:vitamin B12 transporter